MTTEREWHMENAKEHVALIFDADTGKQSHLAILDADDIVLDGIDRSTALAMAARLVELSIELPPSSVSLPVAQLAPELRTVRRLRAVGEGLRDLDG